MISNQARQAFYQIYLPSLLMALGVGMMVPALPMLGKTFGVSVGLAVQVFTAQTIGRAVCLIPGSIINDRFGLRIGMITGAAIGVLSAVVTALATSFWLILLAQFSWGLGLNLWRMGRELAAIDMVAVDQRGRQISALYGIQSTGEALGPALGGIILDQLGFRSLFLIFAAIVGVVLVISTRMRESKMLPHLARETTFGFARISQIEPHYRSTYIVLLFASFCATSRSEVLKSMLPLYAVNELGYSATDVGFLFFVIGVTTFLMIIPAGFISDKLGRKWAATPPALLAAISFVFYPLVTGMPGLLAMSVIMGIVNGMALGSMTIYTYDIVPDHSRAQLQAMRRASADVGAFTGPTVGGAIANTFSAGISFLFFAPLHLLSGLLLIFATRESLHRFRGKQ